jgi:hypothetical protein
MRKFLVIFILIAVTGGQWFMLQSVAWAGMLINNLRHDSLQTAVEQTFDGKHACPLCRAIAAAKKSSEKKSDVEIKITRFEFTSTCEHWQLAALADRGRAIAEQQNLIDSSSRTPPLRPPRSAVV